VINTHEDADHVWGNQLFEGAESHRPRPRTSVRDRRGSGDEGVPLEYVREESKRCFGQGLTSLEASKRIDFGPYGDWRGQARLYLNVERAYREFRNEPVCAPWNLAKSFDSIYEVAKARGMEVEF